MADGLKNAGNFELTLLAGFGVPQGDRLELRLALHGDDLAIPREGDLGVGCGTVGHDLRGAQLVAAMHKGHRVGEPGEESGLLNRGVTATNDGDVFAGEEEPVTSGAPRHAAPGQPRLILKSEFAVGRSHGEDNNARPVGVSVSVDELLDLTGEVDIGDVVGDELGSEPFGLGTHLRHEVGAHDPLGEARVVFDLGGLHEGAAGIH